MVRTAALDAMAVTSQLTDAKGNAGAVQIRTLTINEVTMAYQIRCVDSKEPLDYCLLDGSRVGDRLLEGVKFKITLDAAGELVVACATLEETVYLSGLDEKYWLQAAKERVMAEIEAQWYGVFEHPDLGDDEPEIVCVEGAAVSSEPDTLKALYESVASEDGNPQYIKLGTERTVLDGSFTAEHLQRIVNAMQTLQQRDALVVIDGVVTDDAALERLVAAQRQKVDDKPL